MLQLSHAPQGVVNHQAAFLLILVRFLEGAVLISSSGGRKMHCLQPFILSRHRVKQWAHRNVLEAQQRFPLLQVK